MKQWIRQYLVYVLLAASLLFNITLVTSNQRVNDRMNALQNLVDESAVTLEIYDAEELLVKSVEFLPGSSNMSLYTLLLTLKERNLLEAEVATSGWITSLNGIEGTGAEGRYWAMFSPTNTACKGYSDPGYGYDDVCQLGAKDILIGFKDSFAFRLLAWGA